MLPTQFGVVPVGPNPRCRRHLRVAGSIAGSFAVVAASALGGWLAFDDGPVHPDRWDPRVAALASFVERARGLEFDHPIHVYFLSEDEYSAIAGGGDVTEPTAQDREMSDRGVQKYRALGLMEGAPDRLAANETLMDSGTLAFYSPDDDVVNVRGTTMTVGLRVTLVHELTHALQDQHFDLTQIGSAGTADEAGAARSVVEGDAVAVENRYIAQLDDSERSEYDAERSASGAEAGAAMGGVPDVLQVLFGSYYAVGNAFVDFWQASAAGEPLLPRIDSVLRRLPTSSAQLFEPSAYLARRRPVPVPPPEPTGLVEDLEVSTLGTDLLFVVFAERIDGVLALAATDGWRGDAYRVGVDEDGRLCLAAAVELSSSVDAAEFHEAAVAWAAAMPAEADIMVSEPSGRTVTFRSCDPGPDAVVGLTGAAGKALALPVARLQIAAEAVAGGRSRTEALCYGTRIVERLSVEDLLSAERTPAVDEAVAAATALC